MHDVRFVETFQLHAYLPAHRHSGEELHSVCLIKWIPGTLLQSNYGYVILCCDYDARIWPLADCVCYHVLIRFINFRWINSRTCLCFTIYAIMMLSFLQRFFLQFHIGVNTEGYGYMDINILTNVYHVCSHPGYVSLVLAYFAFYYVA